MNVERRFDANGELKTVAEAVVKVDVNGDRRMSVAEGNGPVNALDRALRKDLGELNRFINDLELVDYKVRILNGGTEAVTRVLIESRDGEGNRWLTVGVSSNIIDASFEALLDAVNYKLVKSLQAAGALGGGISGYSCPIAAADFELRAPLRAQTALQHRQDVLRAVGDHAGDLELRADEADTAHLVEEPHERIPEAGDIGEKHRLLVAPELRPGHLLDQLLQRADAAGQRDEGVCLLEHQHLSLMHVFGDDELGQLCHRALAALQEARNDPGDAAAAVEHRAGERSHEADGAAAIDEAHARIRHGTAEGAGRFLVGRVGPEPRAAINANACQTWHERDRRIAPAA